MSKTEKLLKRLDEIGKVLERKGGAEMLLGLGSVGMETERLDEYSDLDFFVIVKPGYKERYIRQLDWLEEVYPLAYSFRNTDDGCKILFDDGIYGEYAIFEERELESCHYAEGRVVWKAPSYTRVDFAKPSRPAPRLIEDSLDHPLNEALTNLYVGLGRYARGEKLTATRFVQSYAVGSILSVLHLLETEEPYFPDVFGLERRLEKRYPRFAANLGEMIQGYDRVPESALCILQYIERVYPVNQRLAREIRQLANICRQL
ncbi:hypothetical protein [Paenibacillus mucilaginosus]|uniref:Uncharacterized protein n=1 Tax=Paenibacillus mucilaginosus (strain KNP414) TaxID=1036673 RepID=F8FJP1_PAEMK|nr:hypothetical protein [Paenibacillus mucilaginosus]AEI42891.1 hypothetical protein KNP414_04359 [Paenibacillus mucilaginosus KNP414]MCG7216516.1 hypothetical protein [Paenibacillus mucilaginosus]WDM31054.1 hypothetical protein KCX80_18705 [Paenibacillus mucilaginosus]